MRQYTNIAHTVLSAQTDVDSTLACALSAAKFVNCSKHLEFGA